MGRKLFVGNIPWSASESDLSSKFEEVGSVISTKIIMDRETGRSRGFGFVEMSSDQGAEIAIRDLNNTDFLGRDMKVNEAQENNRPSSKSRTARPIDHLRYVMSYPLPDGGNVSDLLRGDQRFQEIKNMLDR